MKTGKTFLLTAVLAAVSALAGACASTPGARPQPFPTPSGARGGDRQPAAVAASPPDAGNAAPIIPAVPLTAREAAVLNTAMELRGIQYRDGGSDPSGFDCSGFTQWVFARNGFAIPRQVRDQFRNLTPVEAGSLAPGDLVFFATTSSSASHVGIAIGDGTFVHAPSSRGVVRVERLGSNYWASRFIGVRRVMIDDEE